MNIYIWGHTLSRKFSKGPAACSQLLLGMMGEQGNPILPSVGRYQVITSWRIPHSPGQIFLRTLLLFKSLFTQCCLPSLLPELYCEEFRYLLLSSLKILLHF